MLETRDVIVAPTTKPASEILFGRPVRKVSPSAKHALLQSRLDRILSEWCGDAGFVGPEQEFRIGPPGEAARSLVPDVCYFPLDEGGLAPILAAQYPAFPPLLAVEILSPTDRATRVAGKIEVLRRSGTAIVLVVDPEEKSLTIFDDAAARVIEGDDVFTHPLLPGLTIPLATLFRDFP